jgi:hypothetical protein
LHLAIITQDPALFKLVLMEKVDPSLLENVNSISDIKGNLK